MGEQSRQLESWAHVSGGRLSTMAATATEIWIPAAAALAGAFVGSIAPIFTAVWQGRKERQRERLRLAVELTVEQHRAFMEAAKAHAERYEVSFPPMTITLLFTADLLRDMSSDRKISPARLLELRARSRKLHETLREASEADPPG